MTFGFVNAGEFAPTFHEPNLWRSLHVKSHRKLANSNPIYENVGYLKGVNTAEHKTVYGNAVYLSERMCITAAHLLEKNMRYEIIFNKKNYHVEKIFIHEAFTKDASLRSSSNDLAILLLEEDVVSLRGLSIADCRLSENSDLLTVGFSPDYMWDGFINGPMPTVRKAFWFVGGAIYQNILLSLPYGLSMDCETQRPLIPCEGQSHEGGSGSAVFHPNYGLVGIVSSLLAPHDRDIVCPGVTVRKDWMRDVNNTRLSARTMWVLLAIGYYMIPVYSFFYNIMKYFDVEEYMPNHTWFTKPCGAMTAVMLLPRHKEWIEKIRREQIGSDV